jgi:hypothetical protein
MEARVRSERCAQVVSVWMAFAVTKRAREHAKRVRRQKKEAVRMAFVGSSQPIRIRTMNAWAANAVVRERASLTMVLLAPRRRVVCPGIASMVFVAAMRAQGHAKPVRLRKRAAESRGNVQTLLREPIQTPNAAAIVMAREPAH